MGITSQDSRRRRFKTVTPQDQTSLNCSVKKYDAIDKELKVLSSEMDPAEIRLIR
jgi:hypothetical protein